MTDATEALARLRALSEARTKGKWKDVDGFCSATGEMYIGIKRSELEWEIARKPTREAIVAAMNALSPLLDAAEALGDLASWFTTTSVGGQVWMIPAGARGADDAITAARAALSALAKLEEK